MLIALLVACAAHNGDLPKGEYEERQPSAPASEQTAADERAEDKGMEDMGAGGAMGGMGAAMGRTTRMALARLEPRGGSKVRGTVTFTETSMGAMDHMGGTSPDTSGTSGGMGGTGATGTTGGMGGATSGTAGGGTAGEPDGMSGPTGTTGTTGPSGSAGSTPGTAGGSTSTTAPSTAGTMPSTTGPGGMEEIHGPAGMERVSNVRVVIDVQNAPQGELSVFVHENRDCSAVEGANAGKRFNPMASGMGGASGSMGGPSGSMGGATGTMGGAPGTMGDATGTMGGMDAGKMAGDLATLTVSQDGMAHSEVTLQNLTLGEGPMSVNGHAVVVEQKAAASKAGAAPQPGKVVACGVVTAQVAANE